MAEIIPFQTKAERQQAQIAAATSPTDLHTLYRTHTLGECSKLMTFYQQSGNWSPACETLMVRAVETLVELCALISTKDRHVAPTTR